jgi:hypothetical protein
MLVSNTEEHNTRNEIKWNVKLESFLGPAHSHCISRDEDTFKRYNMFLIRTETFRKVTCCRKIKENKFDIQ